MRLAARAIHDGLPDVDAAAIRLAAPRRFTQEISRVVYECEAADGEPLAGIRYGSRLDDATVNWAIFEPGFTTPPPLHALDSERVHADDPDVRRAVQMLGLRLG